MIAKKQLMDSPSCFAGEDKITSPQQSTSFLQREGRFSRIDAALKMKGYDETYDAGSQDLSAAVSRLRTANDAISTLVSALTYQATARTLNQESCDYCGERYLACGPMAWTSHNCKVLTAAENIISECVQHLLRERAIAKNEVERYLLSGAIFLRHSN